MNIYIRKISRKVKDLREEKNLTQEELARNLGISRQSIISVERGRCLPSLPLAAKIAEMFNQSLDELFCINNSNIRKEGEEKMPRYITPWSPFSDLDRFFEEDDTSRFRGRALAAPLVNVKQTEKDVILTADIPGVKEEDINIEVGDEFVDITGERKDETEEKEEGYLRREISYGSFARRIPLPTVVSADNAQASIKDGQLRLVIPKLEPAKPKVTKIKIKKE